MLNDALSHLSDLVGFGSVSSQSNLPVAAHIRAYLERCGARVEWMQDGGKANLWATIGADGPGGLVLSGHLDVVPVDGQGWTMPPFELTRKGTRRYGRGASDMLGFVACVLAVAPRLVKAPPARPVHIALTHDEEVGCLGAKRLVEELSARGEAPALCLVGEPTGMQIAEAHKGVNQYTTRFLGQAGHGSAPGKGTNAAFYAARFAIGLEAIGARLRGAHSPFDPPETTINIGGIHAGLAHNIIPERADVDWEFREISAKDFAFVQSQVSTLEEELQDEMRAKFAGATVTRDQVAQVAGLRPQEPHHMRDLMLSLTGQNQAQTVAFATEAGFFQSLGASTVVCGPGHIAQAHGPDEFIEEAQLQACLDLLNRLFARLR